jgi:hypothetical protein
MTHLVWMELTVKHEPVSVIRGKKLAQQLNGWPFHLQKANTLSHGADICNGTKVNIFQHNC